jgi:hypothetical protein
MDWQDNKSSLNGFAHSWYAAPAAENESFVAAFAASFD